VTAEELLRVRLFCGKRNLNSLKCEVISVFGFHFSTDLIFKIIDIDEGLRPTEVRNAMIGALLSYL
jgi:hypothetical protein